MTITPSKLSLNSPDGAYSANLGGSAAIVVAEAGYTGSFRSDLSSCRGVATFLPNNGTKVQGKGPKLTLLAYGVAPGSCAMTFSDANKHTAQLSITVVPSHYKILYRFKGGTDGSNPGYGDLTELHGMLYGTTQAGGHDACPMDDYLATGCGTIYAVDPTTGREHVVYAFQGGLDGQRPRGGLIAVNGLLYGTTLDGGLAYGCHTGLGGVGCGTVFEVNPRTGAHRVIYAFNGRTGTDAVDTQAGLVAVKSSNTYVLYGAGGGGAHGAGAVFRLTPSSSGFTESVLYAFKGLPDGAGPFARLLAIDGNLYGTTVEGGRFPCAYSSSAMTNVGCGTVFEVNMHTGAERVIYSFKGVSTDGLAPYAGLFDVNGALYGTTMWGGSGVCNDPGTLGPGCGTVFEVSPATGVERVLYNFNYIDQIDGKKVPTFYGSWVSGDLIALNGAFYGTAQNGGPFGTGIVYKLTSFKGHYQESVLHSFSGYDADGDHPNAGLFYKDGKFYGTTVLGGSCGATGKDRCGIVFEVTP